MLSETLEPALSREGACATEAKGPVDRAGKRARCSLRQGQPPAKCQRTGRSNLVEACSAPVLLSPSKALRSYKAQCPASAPSTETGPATSSSTPEGSSTLLELLHSLEAKAAATKEMVQGTHTCLKSAQAELAETRTELEDADVQLASARDLNASFRAELAALEKSARQVEADVAEQAHLVYFAMNSLV